MKKLLLFFVFAVSATWSFSGKPDLIRQNINLTQAQSGNPFNFFNAHKQGFRSIGLMWRTSSAHNMLCFQIQRSYDGEFFDPIADLPCDGSSRFTWEDENVFPGYIYYRIAANLMDGTTYYSGVEVVHIVQK
jgi:hypothetical protein